MTWTPQRPTPPRRPARGSRRGLVGERRRRHLVGGRRRAGPLAARRARRRVPRERRPARPRGVDGRQRRGCRTLLRLLVRVLPRGRTDRDALGVRSHGLDRARCARPGARDLEPGADTAANGQLAAVLRRVLTLPDAPGPRAHRTPGVEHGAPPDRRQLPGSRARHERAVPPQRADAVARGARRRRRRARGGPGGRLRPGPRRSPLVESGRDRRGRVLPQPLVARVRRAVLLRDDRTAHARLGPRLRPPGGTSSHRRGRDAGAWRPNRPRRPARGWTRRDPQRHLRRPRGSARRHRRGRDAAAARTPACRGADLAARRLVPCWLGAPAHDVALRRHRPPARRLPGPDVPLLGAVPPAAERPRHRQGAAAAQRLRELDGSGLRDPLRVPDAARAARRLRRRGLGAARCAADALAPHLRRRGAGCALLRLDPPRLGPGVLRGRAPLVGVHLPRSRRRPRHRRRPRPRRPARHDDPLASPLATATELATRPGPGRRGLHGRGGDRWRLGRELHGLPIRWPRRRPDRPPVRRNADRASCLVVRPQREARRRRVREPLRRAPHRRRRKGPGAPAGWPAAAAPSGAESQRPQVEDGPGGLPALRLREADRRDVHRLLPPYGRGPPGSSPGSSTSRPTRSCRRTSAPARTPDASAASTGRTLSSRRATTRS